MFLNSCQEVLPFSPAFFKRVVKGRYAFLACAGFLLKTNNLKKQGPVPERPISVRLSRRRLISRSDNQETSGTYFLECFRNWEDLFGRLSMSLYVKTGLLIFRAVVEQ